MRKEPLRCVVVTRLTQSEYAAIQRRAATLQIPASQIIRSAVRAALKAAKEQK